MKSKKMMLDGDAMEPPAVSGSQDEKENEQRLIALHDILVTENNEDKYYSVFGFEQFHEFSAEEAELLKEQLDHDTKLCNDLWGRSVKDGAMRDNLIQAYTRTVNKFTHQGTKKNLDKIIQELLHKKLAAAIQLLRVSGGENYTLRYWEINHLSELSTDLGIPPASSSMSFNFQSQLESICDELKVSIPETEGEFIRCVHENFGASIIQTEENLLSLTALFNAVHIALSVLEADGSRMDHQEFTERDMLNTCKKNHITLRVPGTAFIEDYLNGWIRDYAPEGLYSSDAFLILADEAKKSFGLETGVVSSILSERELVEKTETAQVIPFFKKHLYVFLVSAAALSGVTIFLLRLLDHLADSLPLSKGQGAFFPISASLVTALAVSTVLFLFLLKISGLTVAGSVKQQSRIPAHFLGAGLAVLAVVFLIASIRIVTSSNLGWMLEDISVVQNKADARIIPSGSFIMGSESSGWDDQAPAYKAKIAFPILVKRYEENSYDVKTVLGSKKVIPDSEKQIPARNISWTTALIYCNELSKKDKLDPVYDLERNRKGEVVSLKNYNPENSGWRLPTEEEWEYISKRGEIWKSSIFPTGYESHAGSGGVQSGPSPINEGRPNMLGIYHLGGNVMEWCFDKYGVYLDKSTGIKGYSQATKGDKRVVRGGSWATDDLVAEIGYRNSADPTQGNEEIGLRLVRTLK